MPRSAAKPQADKRGRRTSLQVTPPPVQDTEMEDIISGRLTQAQWIDMLIQEDADEAVGEIMEELLSNVMGGCLKVHIERQLAPFCASWAKSYLTEILEQQIMCLDAGEGPDEASKTEDSEPEAATLDAWAHGCVPVIKTTPQPHPTSPQEADIGPAPEQTQPSVNQQCNLMVQTNHSPKQSEKETSPRRSVSDIRNKLLSPCPPPKVQSQKKKQQVNLPPKPVPSQLLPPLSCSAEKRDVKVEGKNATGSLNRHKDYHSIPKLDHTRLPRHCIVPQYEILDNSKTKPNHRKHTVLPKLDSRYNKKETDWTLISMTSLSSSNDQLEKFQRRSEGDVWLRQRQRGMASSGPLRLDTMDLAKGVSLLDPLKVDIDSFKFHPPAQSTKMRRIQSEGAVPVFSVDQVTAGPPPRVTPFCQSEICDN